MATLYITEYIDLAASEEPPLAEHVLDIGAESTASEPFDARTRSIRFHSDVPCSVVIGSNPVATRDNQRLGKNHTDTKKVPAGQGFRIAVIANESSASDETSAVLEIVKLITNPKAAEKTLEEMSVLRNDIAVRQADLTTRTKKLARDQAVAEKAATSKNEELTKREATLDAKSKDQGKRESDLTARETAAANTEKTQAAREKALDTREKALRDSEVAHQAELKALADSKTLFAAAQAAQAKRENKLQELLKS